MDSQFRHAGTQRLENRGAHGITCVTIIDILDGRERRGKRGSVRVRPEMQVSRIAFFGVLALCLAACAPLAGRESRAAKSSLSCMQHIRDEKLPPRIDDDMKHCVAAGLIARYCSRSEAWMASYGKELKDLFGPGDAQWRDIQADRRGIGCARSASSDADVQQCCAASSAR